MLKLDEPRRVYFDDENYENFFEISFSEWIAIVSEEKSLHFKTLKKPTGFRAQFSKIRGILDWKNRKLFLAALNCGISSFFLQNSLKNHLFSGFLEANEVNFVFCVIHFVLFNGNKILKSLKIYLEIRQSVILSCPKIS